MKFNKLQKKNRQQKVTVLLSEVIKNKEANQRIFLGSFRQKKNPSSAEKNGRVS